jgi:hypothetical protein
MMNNTICEDIDDVEDTLDELEEVEVLDGEVSECGDMDNEEEEVEGDDMDLEVQPDVQPESDSAFFVFTEHTDSVYCASLHPSQEGVVVSGKLQNCECITCSK